MGHSNLHRNLHPVSGGVMVDGCMRSSDPNIYAVGEVASYEGGMVYGLWKPGMEQAEARRLLRPESLWGDGTSDLW